MKGKWKPSVFLITGRKNMKNEITKLEAGRLADLEIVIEKGKRSFVEVGNALAEIRNARLYRKEFKTFDGYCEAKWGWTRSYACRLIESAEIKLLPIGNRITNEGQARELSAVEPERRESVMATVVAAGPVTAKAIKVAAAVVVDAVRLDGCKRPIPAKLVPLWDRADGEASDGMAAISKIRTALCHAQKNEDVIYREMNFSATITALNNAYTDMKRVKPFSVCYICHGLRSDKCEACKGRGFLSKFFYDQCVPEELK